MEFEVSFRETLRQLADAQVRLNTMGKVLDTNAKKAGDMESATSRAANQIRIQFEQLNRYLDRNRLATNQMGNELAQAQKKAEKAFLAMANSNMTATSKLQALKGELGNLDRLVKDTAQKKAYTKWLEKSAVLSADMAGRSQHLRDRLASLDTAQARVNARLTEYVKAKERSLGADAKLLTSNRELQQALERLDSVEGRRSVNLKRQLQDKRQEIGYIDSQVAKTAQLRREKEFLESIEGREQQRLRAQVSALKQVNTATEQLTQAKALENAQTSRLINQVKLQNQLRNAEALASQKVTAADRRQTEALREQIREYERRAKLAAMSNAQLLGMSSSASKLSRDLHINAQAAAMFRAGLAGLNASIGIYTSATVLAATATYAIAAAMRDTVSVGIEFTDTMARAEAVMMTGSHAITEAGRSMEGMEMQVRALGASTMFTATQVSGALVELGMAGLSSTEAMTSLAPTLDLAAIGNVEMGRAADIATNVMTAFNKTAGEMTGVVDLLAYAITNSNTNLEQLANSISYVGPAAQAAGFELEETVAAIQTLANAGIKGSRAGTGLRRMMVNLQNPTARGAKVIEDFNINLTNVDGTTRTLTDILANFNAEMAGVSDAERMAAIVDLFGVRASQSAARLIDASAEVANFRREMELAGGSAQAMREKIEDTLGADWKKLKSAFQDIQLDVFESFEQQLRSTTAEMTVFLAKQQEINEAMSLQAGFTPEQIASGEGISELEILIGTMYKALDIALRLGAAFVAFKTFKGATTAVAALSNQMQTGFIPRLQEVNGRLTQHALVQRNAAMAAAATNSSFTAASVGFRAYSSVVGAATAATYGLAASTQWLARVVSTYLGPITMVATAGYAVYSAVKYGFKDSEDYVLDHKARITELEAEYESLGNTIQQIEHTRSRRALDQRESDIRTEIEGIQAQIEVYEQLNATATGEYAEIYAARLSNLTHQLTEQEKALADNIKAQEHLGTSHEQQASVLAQIDTVAKELAEKMDELTAANERVAMGSRGATVQAVELQREVEGLKGQLADLNRTAEETAITMVDVFDQMEIAVGKLREELNEEFRLEGLSGFEKLQEDTRLLNEAREETVELQRRVANGEVELGDSVRRNQEKVLELEESVARARRDNNLAMVDGQSAREEYLAHFLSEEEQIQATKAKMEELNKEIAVMNALMAMGVSVDGERWEKLWEDLLTFQERYDQLTEEDSSTTRQRNQELEEALRLFERLKGSYDAVGMATDTLNEEQGQLKYLLDNGKISAEDFAKASAELTKQYEASIDPLSDIRAELYPVQEAQRVYAENVAAIAEALASGKLPQDEATDAIKHYAEELEKAVEEADPMKKRLKELTEAYDSNHIRMETLKTDLQEISELHRKGEIDGQTYARMWGQINDEMWKLAIESNPAAQEMVRTWEEAWDRIHETFADAYTGGIDNLDDFFDRMIDGWKRTLGEMAYQATLKPIVVQFTQQMGGALGVPGYGVAPGMASATGGGGLPGGLGTAKSAWDAVQSGFGGIQWSGASNSAYKGVGWANSATQGAAANSGFLGGSFRNFQGMQGLASIGTGLAGSWLGSQMFGEGKHSNTLGTLGGAVGTYFGGPIGALAGSTLGSALGGIFGGSWETKDAGLNLGVSSGDVTGNQYERQHKSGGWFSSSKSRVNTSALSGDLQQMLQETYSAQESALQATLETLGQQSSLLNSFSSGLTKISTKGKSEEEVEKAVQEWLQNIVNAAAKSVVDPSEYALSGETTVDTLNRLATALTGVNPLLEQMHGFVYEASLRGGDAASQLLEFSGGLEQFASKAEFYWQNIATEEERQKAAMDQAAKAMGAFTARTGEVVRTSEELRKLVEGLDYNTESGRRLYAAAMDLAPSIIAVEDGMKQLDQRFAEMLSDAEQALSDAEQKAKDAWKAFEGQSYSQQLELLALMGDSETALAMERERELEGMDPLLRETQRRIWAMQDEVKAQEAATEAAKNYVNALSRAREELSSTLGNISQWIDQRMATGGSPGANLSESRAQLARQLVLAESGDRSALQSITQYADQVLQANAAYNASSPAGQMIEQEVLDALKNLPDQVSAEEYIAQEIKDALREQTQGISSRLEAVLRGDNPSNIASNLAGYFATLAGGIDGVLTREQLAVVMSGKATDAELQAIIRAVDLNGDGVMTGLESVVIQSMPTDAILGTTLRNKMAELDANQLTHAQVRSALSPIATDDEISRLISQVDRNGDGIISSQELANARLAGLARGIGNALEPMFDSIDLNEDKLIDWNEFRKSFQGLASDSQLRSIFNKLDTDGSRTISRLETLNTSNEGTEDNTKTLEERARDQLQGLSNLVAEMSRTTNQFVSLNTGIDGLTDMIEALGVANAERARIERAKQAAEIVSKGQVEASRVAHAIGDYNSRLTVNKAAESDLENRLLNLDRQTKDSFGRDSTERHFFNQSMEQGINQADINRIRSAVGKDTDGWINIAGAGRLRDTRVYAVLDELEKQIKIADEKEELKRELDRVKAELASVRASKPASTTSELERLRNQYKDLMGKAAPFAKGGVFTNSIVSTPTYFDMGLMGEDGEEAIMPLSRGPGGDLGVRVHGGGNRSRDDERLIQELRESNAQLRKAVTLLQTGFKDLASTSKASEGHLKSMKRAAKMAEMVK